MASARTDNFLPMETYVKVLLFECPFRLETIQNGLYFSVSPYKENISSEQLKAVMSVKYFVAFSLDHSEFPLHIHINTGLTGSQSKT